MSENKDQEDQENQEDKKDPDVTSEELEQSVPQEGMEPLEIIKSEQIPLSMPGNFSNDIEKTLSQLINLSPGNVLHEVSCVICSSSYRKDIEQKWIELKKDKKNAYMAIKKFIKEKSNIDVSNDVVDNHMLFHYNRGIKELQKIEYLNRIKRLNNIDLTTLDRIRLCLSALTERLMEINSITPTGEISATQIEKIKSSESTKIMAAFDKLLRLQSQILGELKTSGEMITLPSKEFVEIFNETILEAENDGQRQIIKQILDKLMALSKRTQ